MALIYCPDCGKQVSEYAASCPNCGYPINDKLKDLGANTTGSGKTKSLNIKMEKRKPATPERPTPTQNKIHKAVYIISLIGSIILYLRTINYYEYKEAMIEIFVGIAILAILIILYNKSHEQSRQLTNVSIAVSVLVFAVLGTVSLVYSSKFESATSHLPGTKEIYIKADMDSEYYSYDNAGDMITDPKCSIKIDDDWLTDGDVTKITVGSSKIKRIGCSYEYRNKVDGSYTDPNKTITESMINNSSQKATININTDVVGEVTYSFKRVTTFWEVVFD